MTGIVRLIAPTMGGEADTYAELEVELPCSSKPTLAVATFPALDEFGQPEADAKGSKASAAA
jgi:hypothetical protein